MRPYFLMIACFFGLIGYGVQGQNTFGYSVSLEPVAIPNLPGIHSYAFAQHEGKWLIIGGRRDGIHARQPFASFLQTANNTEIMVIDVNERRFWRTSVNNLSGRLAEQMQSANMNFYQDGDTLYLTGGYGFSATANDHITFPHLTSVRVSGLINAVVSGNNNIAPFFKQITDDVFAVTGGQMGKIGRFYYLVGGHRFDGRYNPMNNPTFTQAYTNQIRKFTLNNSGTQLSYANYSAVTDPIYLRRRDFNLLPQIFPDRSAGYTISAGVFQINADLPFLYPVDITERAYTPVTSFSQYLSHYHSAKTCLYDSTANEMHTLFSAASANISIATIRLCKTT